MTTFDHLIVGGGLAGTAVAWALRWRGRRACVLDRGPAGSASAVAAGLVTPVTGKRLAKTWRLAELWPAAATFYERAERDTGDHFWHVRPAVRLFLDPAERDRFAKKAAGFSDHVTSLDAPPDGFAGPHGGFVMTPAARLDVPRYLAASRAAFAADGGFRVADVAPDDIVLSPDGVAVPRLGLAADGLVFCQGVAAAGNPVFPQLRFAAAKGEVLTVRVPGLAEERVVHRGVWLAPAGGGLFRAGATYDRENLDAAPTAAGRAEVEAGLRGLLRLPFAVEGHAAGVRPIVPDQRPVVGVHPRHPRLAVFNGLGSKGTLLAPFFAEQLAAVLTGEAAGLDPAVGLGRLPDGDGPRLTEQAQDAVRATVRPGESVVDATAGNGRDARFLAGLVGPAGRVWAFDVQPAALARTAAMLEADGVGNVTLVCRDHAELAEAVPPGVAAVMFNLGYLPGGDREVRTAATGTVRAVTAALVLLRPGGVLTAVAYSGHPGGLEEADAVRRLLRGLPSGFEVREARPGRRKAAAAPVLFVVRKWPA